MATIHEAKRTQDHDTIQRWVDERGGSPAVVRGTHVDESGLLRIDFGDTNDQLEDISWDEFFKIFDENNIEFLYQDKTDEGDTSRFFKFVLPEVEKER